MQAINYDFFKLKESYFDNHSFRHGIKHTYRVMVHVLKIGEMAGLNHIVLPTFCAAYIHDMGRQHDGYCTIHGENAAREKLPLFQKMFREQGVDDLGLEAISMAVAYHSLNDEVDKYHRHYKTIALLKDADALDRIRISKSCLDPEYLRFPESHSLVGFAESLFYETDEIPVHSFKEVYQVAERILAQE